MAFTGAGASAEAGIPTFRGKGGLWDKYKPEELATPHAFSKDPKKVWEWYKWRMSIISRAKPTRAHEVLAKWEERGISMGVVTQNVDGLHQVAGSKNVVELHGSVWRVRCSSCGIKYDLEFGRIPEEELPTCRRCHGLLRPDVVWFGEPIPHDQFNRAQKMFSEAEVILVIGTSGAVMPAAMLPINAAMEGKVLIEINPEETNLSSFSTIKIREPAGKAFDKLDKILWEEGSLEDR